MAWLECSCNKKGWVWPPKRGICNRAAGIPSETFHEGHLGGSTVEHLPLAQGVIPASGIKFCIGLLAGSLLLSLPMCLPLSVWLSWINKILGKKKLFMSFLKIPYQFPFLCPFVYSFIYHCPNSDQGVTLSLFKSASIYFFWSRFTSGRCPLASSDNQR